MPTVAGIRDDQHLAAGGHHQRVVAGGPWFEGHLDPDALAWTSPDGLTWEPQEMPAADGAQDVHRVTLLDDGRLLAVGRSDDAYATWVRDADGWHDPVGFGRIADSWHGSPYVASLATTSDGVWASVSTGDHYELWHTKDGRAWQQVAVPLEPQTAGDHTMSVAAGGEVLVVADAGDGGHVLAGEPVSS